MMAEVSLEDLRLATLPWARRHGILSETMLLEEDGNPELVPFDDQRRLEVLDPADSWERARAAKIITTRA